jgi:hypothetical protein
MMQILLDVEIVLPDALSAVARGSARKRACVNGQKQISLYV